MTTFSSLRFAQSRVPLAIAAGLTLAVLCGLMIGTGDFGQFKRIGLLTVFVAYALFLQSHTWKIGLLICLVGFNHIGFGFRLSTVEMSGFVAALLISLNWWRKQRLERPPVKELFAFRLFNLALLAWVLYSAGHAVHTIMDPFNAREFAIRNFLKTVVGMTGPPLLLFYFIHRPRGIDARENLLISVAYLSLVGLIINILVRIWGMAHGIYNPELAAQFGESDTGYFLIPGLDLTEDPYALRIITPFTAAASAVLIGTDILRSRSFSVRLAVYLTLLLSFLGALLSGGRATVLFVLFLTGAAFWIRKHYRTVFSVLFTGALTVLVLNLLPGILQTVPPVLQRSLQMVVFTDESEFATLSIRDSTRWRSELFHRALEEWRSHPRIFWFGRGTYKYGMEDVIAAKRDVARGHMETALRRGATHSLVTDLLVVYGLCGALIYALMVVGLLWYLWRIRKHPSLDETARSTVLAALLLLAFNYAYGVIGGATFPIHVTWMLIALFGYLYRRANTKDVKLRQPALRPGMGRVSLSAPKAALAGVQPPTVLHRRARPRA